MVKRLGLSSQRLPGTTLISIEGDLDVGAADQFDAYVRQARKEPGDHLVIDLTEVQFLDSAGLRVILHTNTYATRHGGSVRLAGPRRTVEKVVRLAKIDQHIPVHETTADALRAALTGEPPEQPPTRGSATA